MANYTILVKAILDQADLQSQLNKMATNIASKAPKVKAGIELDPAQIEQQMQLWRNKLTKMMQVSDPEILNTKKINDNINAVTGEMKAFAATGGKSVKEVQIAFDNLATSIKVAKQNLADTKQGNVGSTQMMSGLQEQANLENKIYDEKISFQKRFNSDRDAAYTEEIRRSQEQAGVENKIYDEKASFQKKLDDDRNAAYTEEMNRSQGAATTQNKIMNQDAAYAKKKQEDQLKLNKTVDDYNNKLATLELRNKKAFAAPAVVTAKSELEKAIAGLDGTTTAANKASNAWNKLNLETTKVNQSMINVNKNGFDFGTMFELAAKKVFIWLGATTLVYGTLREIQKGIQYIRDLNKEMTNIQIVTGMASDEIGRLAVQFNDLATELGATTKEVASGSLEWFRQGKTIQETAELMKSTMMMSKLGNMESAQATEYLTSMLNGFNLEAKDSISLIDKLTSLDNAFATSTGEIASAMQRSANSAQQAGVSYDELASYITVISSVTRKSSMLVNLDKFGAMWYNS